MKTILAPIDFSPVTERVVAHASELAAAFRGRVVILATLIEPVFLAEYAPPPANLARVMVGAENDAKRRLAKIAQRLASRAIPVQTLLERGSPAAVITATAKKIRASYIVMGSHGHTAFYELIAGSTTQGVLKSAPCPVVIVPRIKAPKRTRSR